MGNISGETAPASGRQFTLNNNAYLNTSENWVYKHSSDEAAQLQMFDGKFRFRTAPTGTADSNVTFTERLLITNDGRGLSQFTAKVWCSYDLSGTASFFDSHNCSSLTDNGTGDTTINFTNNMANTNYAIAGMSNDPGYIIALRDWTYVYVGSIRLATTNSSGSLLDARRAMIVLFGD